MFFEFRIKQLEDNIKQDMKMPEEYEYELRYATEPHILVKHGREVERRNESLIQYQQECKVLKNQVTGELSAALQNSGTLLQQKDIEQDDIRKRHGAMHDELTALYKALVAHFISSNQNITSSVIQHLNDSPHYPLILSYEGEIGMKSIVNLKKVWHSLRAEHLVRND